MTGPFHTMKSRRHTHPHISHNAPRHGVWCDSGHIQTHARTHRVVSGVTQDGRFNIDYDDGDVEKGVKRGNIRSRDDDRALAALPMSADNTTALWGLKGVSEAKGPFSAAASRCSCTGVRVHVCSVAEELCVCVCVCVCCVLCVVCCVCACVCC